MSLSMMGKTSGVHFLGMCFQFASMSIQVACGVVQGLGPYLMGNEPAASIQVIAVAVTKLTWAAILFRMRPCAPLAQSPPLT